jgi:F-type H+-transporting ATPase subunit epsilon
VAEFRRPFDLDVLTPAGSVWSGQTVYVSFPAADGMMGVLGARAPLASTMGAGALRVHRLDEEALEFFIAGGFTQVRDNTMVCLAEDCVPAKELDPETAWSEIERAEALPRETAAEQARREHALTVARARFRLAQREARRRRGGPPRPAHEE